MRDNQPPELNDRVGSNEADPVNEILSRKSLSSLKMQEERKSREIYILSEKSDEDTINDEMSRHKVSLQNQGSLSKSSG